MFVAERMKKIEIHVLKTQIDGVLTYIGLNPCLQFIPEKIKENVIPEAEAIQTAFGKINSLFTLLGLSVPQDLAELPADYTVDRRQLVTEAGRIIGLSAGFLEETEQTARKKADTLKTLEELKAFARLKVSFSQLENLSFFTLRIGTVDAARLEALAAALQNRGVIIHLDKPGYLLAFSSKKGKWALDTELKKFNFKALNLPSDFQGLPAEIFAGLEKELQVLDQRLTKLAARAEEFKQKYQETILKLMTVLKQLNIIDNIKKSLQATESVYKILGWIPVRRIKKVMEDLERLTEGMVAVQVYQPKEIDEVLQGRQKVPVLLKNNPLIRAFEGLVFSYGAPLYGTINPTPFVAFFFILMFAIMFGDMGQGFVGLLIGIVLSLGKIKALAKFQKYGIIFLAIGSASMITGFLYGEFFANGHVLVPVTHFISSLIFKEPVDHFITLLPKNGVGKLLYFFGFTIAVGFVINSLGLVINIINKFKMRDFHHAILHKTGLVGAWFFWYAGSIVIKILLGGRFLLFDLILLLIPLVLLYFGEPLNRYISGHRPVFTNGVGTFIIEGFIEIIEAVSYFFSNSVSFVRVGAFALSHAVLSFIVFTLSELVSSGALGLVFSSLIVVIGNLFIIGLEGMIVTIQIIRLEYYEFFSKFFTELGEKFRPFTLAGKNISD